jgi:bacitracin synthase 1
MKGLRVTSYGEAREVTRFELSLGLSELEDRIVGTLEYDENMFTETTTRQMLDDYFHIISAMVANPNGEISSISLTRNEEIEELASSFAANLEV